jgi:hypothetical protein
MRRGAGGLRGPSSFHLALLGLGLGLVACGARPRAGAVLATDAIVRIHSNLADAAVWVDGHFVGTLDGLRGGVAVEPGAHRFELRHDEYFSRYLELTLAKAERRALEVSLAPVLP